jgi:hypothetical protein
MLRAIEGRRAKERIRYRIDSLALDPDNIGKPLTGGPTGY